MNMNPTEFIRAIINLPGDVQNEFFESLKGILTEEERETVMKMVALTDMLTNPTKYKTMRTALCEEMFGLSVPMSLKVTSEL